MDNSTSRVGSSENIDRLYAPNPLSRLKAYGFAIAIIVSIGGLVVGGIGVAGYFGEISNLNQLHAIIMMAAGGGSGIILFLIGVVGTVKNCQSRALQTDSGGRTRKPMINREKEIIRKTDTKGGLVYGADAWIKLGVEVLDGVPPAPEVSWSENDPYFNEAYRDNYVLLYIPQRIKVGSEEKDLTLQTLREINSDSFASFTERIAEQFGDSTSHGWVLVSKKVIPDSQKKNYEAQKDMIEEKEGFRMPHTLEAIAVNLMAFAGTNESSYGIHPLIYTRCVEKIDGKYPVVIGGFLFVGLDVYYCSSDSGYYGGVAALRKF